MIRLLLQQQNCITKMELVRKIVSSHSDIVDRSKAMFYVERITIVNFFFQLTKSFFGSYL